MANHCFEAVSPITGLWISLANRIRSLTGVYPVYLLGIASRMAGGRLSTIHGRYYSIIIIDNNHNQVTMTTCRTLVAVVIHYFGRRLMIGITNFSISACANIVWPLETIIQQRNGMESYYLFGSCFAGSLRS